MFMFVLLYRVCMDVILGILETIVCVYVCVGVEVIYTCNTGNVGNDLYVYVCVGV